MRLDESVRMRRTKRAPLFLMARAIFIDFAGFGLILPLLLFWAHRLGASAVSRAKEELGTRARWSRVGGSQEWGWCRCSGGYALQPPDSQPGDAINPDTIPLVLFFFPLLLPLH